MEEQLQKSRHLSTELVWKRTVAVSEQSSGPVSFEAPSTHALSLWGAVRGALRPCGLLGSCERLAHLWIEHGGWAKMQKVGEALDVLWDTAPRKNFAPPRIAMERYFLSLTSSSQGGRRDFGSEK